MLFPRAFFVVAGRNEEVDKRCAKCIEERGEFRLRGFRRRQLKRAVSRYYEVQRMKEVFSAT